MKSFAVVTAGRGDGSAHIAAHPMVKSTIILFENHKKLMNEGLANQNIYPLNVRYNVLW